MAAEGTDRSTSSPSTLARRANGSGLPPRSLSLVAIKDLIAILYSHRAIHGAFAKILQRPEILVRYSGRPFAPARACYGSCSRSSQNALERSVATGAWRIAGESERRSMRSAEVPASGPCVGVR